MPATQPSTLLLFTESYPYAVGLEDTFLEPELPHLRAAFDRLIVIPSVCQGSRAHVPDGIEVDEGLAGFLAAHAGRPELAGLACRSSVARHDLLERPSLLLQPRAVARLAATAGRAELTRRWVRGFLEREAIPSVGCLAYTFWCGFLTAGLALMKREAPDLVLVSRAHGADLYAERHDPPYLPARAFTLQGLDRLLPDSQRGVDYVHERYPWFASRCAVARMGVDDPGFVTRRSPAGHFAIASCSRIVPVKRVDLILRAIDQAARQRPDIAFEWHHVGDGSDKEALETRAATTLSANVIARFPGYSSSADLFTFYRTQPVDAFLNASVSEGTPVSVMEAISCGIPVIATVVGGNQEIVSELNGTLVSPDASAEEIGAAILRLLDEPAVAAAKRNGSRHVWESRYNAATNYAAFARLLVELRAAR
jgi:glycosyltransferase involved in cell wall biosynthesis